MRIGTATSFFGIKERVKAAGAEDGKTQDVPFAEGIRALLRNKYWLMMTGMLALFFRRFDEPDCHIQHYPRRWKCLRRRNDVGHGF
ncbi:MAG: major facilitator superfamily domain-containing protein 7 [Eubacterium sp.]|jgi:Na+/melibiose symporter-like transporter|nr:major facilitator superfamily domain-containing protein 7 [Eubacterium sp.]